MLEKKTTPRIEGLFGSTIIQDDKEAKSFNQS
jgi:hypothetical protein